MNLDYYTDDGEWDKPLVPLTDDEHIDFYCLRGRFYQDEV